jgi:hypothetical protein
MKVSELKKGMMLVPSDSSFMFFVSNYTDPWFNVVPKRRRGKTGYGIYTWSQEDLDKKQNVAVYIGTRSDVSGTVKWSNRYVLFENNVVAVDPSAWRKIRALNNDSS